MWEAFFWDTTSNNLSLTNARYTTDIFPDSFLSQAYLSKLKFSYLDNSFVNLRCNYIFFFLLKVAFLPFYQNLLTFFFSFSLDIFRLYNTVYTTSES